VVVPVVSPFLAAAPASATVTTSPVSGGAAGWGELSRVVPLAWDSPSEEDEDGARREEDMGARELWELNAQILRTVGERGQAGEWQV
jgi:hypothetical protein